MTVIKGLVLSTLYFPYYFHHNILFFKDKRVTPLDSGFVLPKSPSENAQRVSYSKP